jgi:hypothetical protein
MGVNTDIPSRERRNLPLQEVSIFRYLAIAEVSINLPIMGVNTDIPSRERRNLPLQEVSIYRYLAIAEVSLNLPE